MGGEACRRRHARWTRAIPSRRGGGCQMRRSHMIRGTPRLLPRRFAQGVRAWATRGGSSPPIAPYHLPITFPRIYLHNEHHGPVTTPPTPVPRPVIHLGHPPPPVLRRRGRLRGRPRRRRPRPPRGCRRRRPPRARPRRRRRPALPAERRSHGRPLARPTGGPWTGRVVQDGVDRVGQPAAVGVITDTTKASNALPCDSPLHRPRDSPCLAS